MSYSTYMDPSPEEAESQYYYNRRQYYNACAESRILQKQQDACVSQKRSISNAQRGLKDNKINFEKRLAGIDKIIDKLEGNGFLFTGGVPADIADADRVMNLFESSYDRSIRVSGIPAADVRQAFGIQTVEGNPNSATAMEIYKQKRKELDESIQDIQRQIRDMDNQMDNLQRQIRYLSDQQWDMSRLMNNSLYNMNHYAKYM